MNITQEDYSKKDPLVEKLNELVDLNQIFDEMWNYHPDNPKMINVVEACRKINIKIDEVSKEIKILR